MDRTLVILKPGVLQRRLMGEIIQRIEKKGLKIVAMKMTRLDAPMVQAHYSEHVEKSWYPNLEKFTVKGPVILMICEGNNAVLIMRKLAGATYVEDMEPGTIRGDFALGTTKPDNCIHTSDSEESAAKEISLFFNPDEISDWADPLSGWM